MKRRQKHHPCKKEKERHRPSVYRVYRVLEVLRTDRQDHQTGSSRLHFAVDKTENGERTDGRMHPDTRIPRATLLSNLLHKLTHLAV